MDILHVPNLTVRGTTYYVKRKINGRAFKVSTGLSIQDSHKEVLKVYNRILGELDRRTDDTAVQTFGEWWHIYYATISVKHATPRREEIAVEFALPTWRDLPMNEITKSMCELHLRKRLATVKQGTATRERGVLQAVFERFIEEQSTLPVQRRVVMLNPFSFIDRIKDAVRDRVLTVEEERQLRGVLSPEINRWLTFMLGTGLRLEEAIQCQAKDLNREARLLAVRASAAKGGKAREVPLFDDGQVEQAVDGQLEAMGRLWHEDQDRYRNLLTAATRYLQPRRQAARRQTPGTWADIPHLSPHALRHTFGTRYLQRGGDIFVLSKILGHSSVKVTEQHYAHLLKEDLVARSRHLTLHQAVA